MPIHWYY